MGFLPTPVSSPTYYTPISSVALSCQALLPHGQEHARSPCPSPTPGAYSNSCPLSWWYHATISSFVAPFSSCLQSFSASRSFQMSQFFASGGQSIGVSASVLSVTIQDWFPLGLAGLISLQIASILRRSAPIGCPTNQFNLLELGASPAPLGRSWPALAASPVLARPAPPPRTR